MDMPVKSGNKMEWSSQFARRHRAAYFHRAPILLHERIPAKRSPKATSLAMRRAPGRQHSRERVRLRILQPRVDLSLQLRLCLLEALGLILIEFPERQHFHDAALSEHDLLRKVG